MKTKLLILVLSMSVFPVYSGDLDDGIGLDTPINDDLQINRNILYMTRRAKSKAKVKLKVKQKNPGNKRIITSGGCEGTGNIKLIGNKLKAGTTIINLSNNEDSSSICK